MNDMPKISVIPLSQIPHGQGGQDSGWTQVSVLWDQLLSAVPQHGSTYVSSPMLQHLVTPDSFNYILANTDEFKIAATECCISNSNLKAKSGHATAYFKGERKKYKN
jgi:hypothetical protein